MQHLQQQQYHVELSSTLYGGGLKTPDTPGSLMTQSMDPSMLLGPLTEGAVPTTAAVPTTRLTQGMTRSLGPEQLQAALSSGIASSRYETLLLSSLWGTPLHHRAVFVIQLCTIVQCSARRAMQFYTIEQHSACCGICLVILCLSHIHPC